MFKKLLFFILLVALTVSMASCKIRRIFCRHNYSECVISPTCTEEGYTEHTCSKCKDSYTDSVVDKLEHTYSSVTTPPTCVSEGYTEYTCTFCGHKYSADIVGVSAHRFNGGACIYCSLEPTTESITPNTEWFNETNRTFAISTKEELAGLASLVNSGLIASDTIIYLDGNIDLGFYEWIPIGTPENPFTATFKGEGYTISSLKMNADQDYVGLFGKVTGSISDFNLVNATIYVKNTHSYIGTVCGYSESAISYISASGYVDAKRSSYVGGVAGAIAALADNVQSSVTVCGTDYVGGIAGMATPESAIFSKLENSGVIEGEISVGGIFGYFNSTGSMQSDYISNTGDVKGKIQVGGIFGYANAKTGSMLYSASVQANIEGGYYVGGIIGRTESITISKCTNKGSTVSATSYLTEETNFYVWLGGYVGSGYEVIDCVNTVSISYNSRGSYVGGVAGYLSYGISNCENAGNIIGFNNVGGVVGYLNTSADANIGKIKNSGTVSGNDAVGGIIGNCSSVYTLTLSAIENTGNVTATGCNVGGIIGILNCENNAVTATNLTNTGNVSSEKYQVGGLFGYAFANQTNSIIKNCTSSANITGTYKVGGLIGSTNIEVKDCSNENSTITATNWYTDGGTDYAWLGGYVGDGYKISGCTNNSDITYTGVGIYVGGIIGYATGEIQNCTNNGNITTNASCVGGIVGNINSNIEITLQILENTGNVSGKQCVGGIVGRINQETTARGATWGADRPTSGSAKYHYYKNESKIQNASNSGNISATDEQGYAGGIIGSIQLNSTYRSSASMCHNTYFNCPIIGCFTIAANNLSNTGMVSAPANAGELMGYHSSDGEEGGVNSSITSYTITGCVIINDELIEENSEIGYTSNNLTLSGREIYSSAEENSETAA